MGNFYLFFFNIPFINVHIRNICDFHNKVVLLLFFFNNVRRPLASGLMMVLYQQTYGMIRGQAASPS